MLTLQARVYNYSLKAMDADTEVHVRFYFTPWNGTVAAGPSVLINEVVANPIPAFSDLQGAPPNWVLVPTTFDTSRFAATKDGNATIVFWVVVWMRDHNGNILQEMPGHGLTGIPPTVPGPTDNSLFSAVSNVEECQSDGNCYSNNVGFFPQVFYVASASVGAVPGPANSTVDIGKVEASADRVTQRGKVVLSTTLSSSGGAASGVNVNFYDGDPDQGGPSFAVVRIPHIAEDCAISGAGPVSIEDLRRASIVRGS